MNNDQGLMPNGKNKYGGRKPAIMDKPPAPMAGMKNDPIPSNYGTQIGANSHMDGDPLPKRRTITTDAK